MVKRTGYRNTIKYIEIYLKKTDFRGLYKNGWILEGFTKTVLAINLGLRYNIRAYVLSMVGRMLSVRYSPPKVILVMSNNLQSKPVGTAETDLPVQIPVGGKGESMKSYIAKPAEVERKWYVVDAEGKTLGRLASEIAMVLRGKRKPTYTPHVDCGDYVIVINAEKVEVTGKKRKEKIYKRHTGYPGGLREVTFEKLQARKPEEIIRHAVKGMLPDGRLGRQMFKKLKVYAGPQHEHAAQKPEELNF